MMDIYSTRRTILNVNQVTLATKGKESGRHVEAHFELFSGQLALVRLGLLDQAASLADAFSGLLPLLRGSIRFLGRDWRDLSPDMANAMRGRIGRIFSAGSWLAGFNLCENILLAQRHHTRRPTDTLGQEAARLAVHFGLPGLPTGDINAYDRGDLQRAACVRAFLGAPSLLLLEDPTFGIYPEILPALVDAIGRARNTGAAVWWMMLSDKVWMNESIPADRLFRIVGGELREVERTL